MIDRAHRLSVSRQARLPGISRGSVYYQRRPASLAQADSACNGVSLVVFGTCPASQTEQYRRAHYLASVSQQLPLCSQHQAASVLARDGADLIRVEIH